MPRHKSMLRFAFSHMHNSGVMRSFSKLVGRPQLLNLWSSAAELWSLSYSMMDLELMKKLTIAGVVLVSVDAVTISNQALLTADLFIETGFACSLVQCHSVYLSQKLHLCTFDKHNHDIRSFDSFPSTIQ